MKAMTSALDAMADGATTGAGRPCSYACTSCCGRSPYM